MSSVPSPSGYSNSCSPESQFPLFPPEMYPMEVVPTDPHLVITEQPVEKFRFRYKSEMMGTHGSILGKSSDKSRRRSYPTVKLVNYSGTAVIRCSLYTAQQDNTQRTQHTHRLVVRVGAEDKDDPHEIKVSEDNNYTAVFQGMGIIHTAKKHITDELIRKKRERMLETLRARKITSLSTRDEMNIKEEAEVEAKRMNLNSVSLCFEAFQEYPDGVLLPICEPVFSTPINNMKSALTGELKICRIDKSVSSCLGGEEVFILVEKVGKKNIKIKFFELDSDDEREVWHDYGRFTELDVHHQYAIVFRTPPYRDTDIDKNVDVCLQLYRPTDGDCSEPIRFTYKPSDKIGRKRQRSSMTDGFSRAILQDACLKIDSLLADTYMPDTTASFGNVETVSGSLDELLKENADKLNSEEFTDFFQKFSNSGSYEDYVAALPTSDVTLTTDSAYGRKWQSFDTRSSLDSSMAKKFGSVSIMEKSSVIEEVVDEEAIPQKIIEEIQRNRIQRKPIFTEKILNMFRQCLPDGNSALHVAIIRQQIPVLLNLLKVLIQEPRYSIVNCSNKENQTPLHLAAISNQPELVSALLEAGADQNLPDKNDNIPLHIVVRNKSNDCLDRLLGKGDANRPSVKLNTKNSEGLTPLHIAIRHKNNYATQKLIAAGADVNVLDRNGRTALHIAAEENDATVAQYLVTNTNIDMSKRNMAGHTAANIANASREGGGSELYNILNFIQVEPQMDTSDDGIPDLSKVKKEPVDGELHIFEEDDDDDDEDEEEEEEEDEEEEIDIMSSEDKIPSAETDKNILSLLQKVQQSPDRQIQSPLKDIKEEPCTSPLSDCMVPDENGLFDDAETCAQVCYLLDKSGGWENLAELLDIGFIVPTIKDNDSPSKLLFMFAELQKNITIIDIRNFLEALDEYNALKAVDAMLKKQKIESTSVS